MLPERTHLVMEVRLLTGVRNYNNVDADNELKGIIDGMQGTVFRNDAWIDEMYMIRSWSPTGTAMAHVRIKTVNKDWLALRALNISRGMVREHGMIGAMRAAIGRLRDG